DALTGAANRLGLRYALDRLLEDASAGQARGAAFYIDLDGFKAVNDELGHAAGDAVLVAVTQALRSALRGEDIVGRLGGDEFIVLARGPRSDFEAQRVARNLLEGVAAVCLAEHPHLRISSSIGIVLVPALALTTSEEVLHAAD